MPVGYCHKNIIEDYLEFETSGNTALGYAGSTPQIYLKRKFENYNLSKHMHYIN